MSSSNITKGVLLSNSGQVRSQNSEISTSTASELVENRLKFEHSIDHNIVSLHVEAHKKRLKKLRKELNYLQETAWKYPSIEKIIVVMSVLTVLTPNGRRQNVKITPNTTLLQVLEEVCAKQGFKAEEYDLRHHNKILDLCNTFQFSGLPNNALLEMSETTRQRLESPVTLGLHLESGSRLTGEFSPSNNLWEVINTLNPEESKSFENPVVIFMRKEVCGMDNLQKTTLRSLGLTGGRAILRFFNKTPEELRTQANVSSVLSPNTISDTKNESSKSPESRIKDSGTPSYPIPALHEKDCSIKKNQKAERNNESVPPMSMINDHNAAVSKTEDTEEELLISNRNQAEDNMKEKSPSPDNEMVKNLIKEKDSNGLVQSGCETICETDKEDKKVILLGERNAVAYNLNKIKPVAYEEVPDEFFDLTVSDVKLLYREAKQLCAELENAPLMTAAQRELEKNKKILSLLNQYKKTVLRIKFPDRTVLQGTFSSVEKISAVEKFVADYLENPSTSFYLYTSPPKEILQSHLNLLEANCVPCAVLYFGLYQNEAATSKQFLRSDVLKKFSSPSAAALTAYQSRGLTNKKGENDDTKNDDASILIPKSDSISVAGPSNSMSPTQVSGHTPREQRNSPPPFKVPKWFKMNK